MQRRGIRVRTLRVHDRATPWNRTRTSRSSAERADLLRKSGITRRGIRLVIVVFGCHAPFAPCRCRFTVSAVLGKPSIHVCCSRLQSGLRDSNSHFQSQSLVFCRLNEARICVGLERFELSPRGVKVRRAAVTPQTQNRVCGRAFESVQHVVGEPRIELGWAGGRVGYNHARCHACLHARKTRKPVEVLPRRAPDRFGSISLIYESGSLRGFACLRSLPSIANEGQSR